MPEARESSLIPNNITFEDIFYHERTHRILICRSCEYAIIPGLIGPHIKKHHKSVHKRTDVFAAIIAYGTALQPDLWTTTAQVAIPRSTVSPYPYLQVYKGFMCMLARSCEKIFTGYNAVHNIETHQLVHHILEVETDEEEHKSEWMEKKKKGRPTKEEAGLIAQRRSRRMRPVLAQRFFHASASQTAAEWSAASYFEVVPRTAPGPQIHADNNCSSDTNQNDARELGQLLSLGKEQRRAHIEVAARTIPEQESNQTNPLLEATGWQEKLANMDFAHVESLSRPPSVKDGPCAKAIWDAVRTMMRAWQFNTKLFGSVIRTAICHEKSAKSPSTTFAPYKDYDTKHVSTIQHLFMFFYRTYGSAEDLLYPQYTFSTSQAQAWEDLDTWLSDAALSRQDRLPEISRELEEDPTRTNLHYLEQLCHKFWLSLIQQEVKKSEWELTLVNALSTRAVTSNGYKRANTLATDFSEIKKMARLAFLQELSHQFPNDEDYPTSEEEEEGVNATSILDRVDRSQLTTPTPLSTIKTWTRRYLNIESNNAIGWVIATGIEIREIQRNADAEGFIQWDGDRLTCYDQTINTNEWKSMVLAHCKDTSDKLFQLLYVEDKGQLPPIPWPLIKDRPGVIHHGYHMFKQEENPALGNQDNFVPHQMQKLLTSNSIPKKWKQTIFVANPQKRPNCIDQYAKNVYQFSVLLAALIHLSYGQQARGTELLSVRFMNTHNHGLRDIFLVQGLLAIVPRWHKGYTQTKKPKPVWRFIPRAVGDLLFWYIWLVLPHLQSLQELVPEADRGESYERAYSEFLFPPWKGKNHGGDASVLTEALRKITHAGVGDGFTLRPIRQITVAMGRKDSGDSGDFMILDQYDMKEASKIADADSVETQSGHSIRTGHLAYANLIGQFSSRLRDRHWKVSTRWHRYIGFTLTQEQLDVLGPDGSYNPKNISQITPVQSARLDRALALALVDPQNLLNNMFGSGSTFKGLQSKVIAALFTDKSPVVYVAGTGSGKSLSFLLPATCPAFGLQIVIVPLVGLRLDIAYRCSELGIHCVEWSPGVRADHARILLVMPEQLEKRGFGALVEGLRKIARIGRIVIDEAHYLLITSPTFRQTMSSLSQLVQREVPIVALTATLPPEEEGELFDRLCFPPDSVAMFREPTSRPNIRYEVERIKTRRFDAQDIANHIQECKQKGGYRKVVVFVPYRNLVTDVTESLKCQAFHGELDDIEKKASLKEFIGKDEAIMVATSALGHGLHDPHIDLVLHFGAPEGLKQYSQESGRAGRDGQPATARIVLPDRFPTWLDNGTPAEISRVKSFLNSDGICRRQALDSYLDGRHDRVRCLDYEAPCDSCESHLLLDPQLLDPHSTSPMSSSIPTFDEDDTTTIQEPVETYTMADTSTTRYKRRRIEHISSRPATAKSIEGTPEIIPQEKDVEELTKHHAHAMAEARDTSTNKSKAAALFLARRIPRALNWWKDRCLFCYLEEDTYDHACCNKRITATAMPVIRCMILPAFRYCFYCLLPQRICSRIKQTNRADNARGGVIVSEERCEFACVAKDVWGIFYAKQTKDLKHLISLMQQHGKQGKESDTTVGSRDFRTYYSSEIELSTNIVIPTLLRDIVIMTEEHFDVTT